MREPNGYLRWLKFDVWFNSGCVMLYTGWLTWQVWRFTSGQEPYGWISISVTVVCMAWFARRARKAFREYVIAKEKEVAREHRN
jgi:hypothetical protein